MLALGSMGLERDRADRWSDLDFFALVEPGSKQQFLHHPEWLAADSRIDWLFRNTPDGFKVLWADGIFAEMAVFELEELARIPFAAGRVVWSLPTLDHARLLPTLPRPSRELPDEHWARDELLSNLVIGLKRFHRGERLSAFRLIQGHCLDRFLDLVERSGPPTAAARDPFDRLRRFELNYPTWAGQLPHLLAGYDATPRAAEAFLRWLSETGPVNESLRAAIGAML